MYVLCLNFTYNKGGPGKKMWARPQNIGGARAPPVRPPCGVLPYFETLQKFFLMKETCFFSCTADDN